MLLKFKTFISYRKNFQLLIHLYLKVPERVESIKTGANVKIALSDQVPCSRKF